MELHPNASIVEMDTIIGTQCGKGGKCMLTIYFRASHLMLIYLLPYKQSKYVSKVFNDLRILLNDDEYSRLFEVILIDNGTEFFDPLSIKINFNIAKNIKKHIIYYFLIYNQNIPI